MRLKNYRICATSIVFILMASVCFAAQIEMKPEGYFEKPGFVFLVYHNNYLVGKRGGLQMFLHGKRVADAGEVVCLTAGGYYLDFNAKEVGRRIVDIERGLSIIPGKIKPVDIAYKLVCSTDGESIILTVKLDKPLDWSRISNLMLKIEIYPKEYQYKTYRGGNVKGYFPERFMGKMILVPAAKKISIAPEDDLRALTITSENATLSLIDGRGRGNINGFIVFAALLPNSSKNQFSMKITPRVNADWRREPVIQVSQVGYHPAQRKMAVLELDSRITDIEKMNSSILIKTEQKSLSSQESRSNGGLCSITTITLLISQKLKCLDIIT